MDWADKPSGNALKIHRKFNQYQPGKMAAGTTCVAQTLDVETGMRRCGVAALVLTGLFLGRVALGQVDPDRRELIEFGYNQPIQGASPPGGYGYYYLNEPNYFHTNVTLRLAFAGVYIDSETGFVGLLGPHTDFGLGLGGGGFIDDYYEIQQGHYIEGQSFFGHAAEGSASVYHLFNPGARIPLNGVLRIREHYSVFARDETNPNFALPSDHSTVAWRAGLRWGGREPLLYPNTAMEFSAWYEGQYRTDSGPYGFGGDRLLNEMSELYWARALLIYTLPNIQQSFDVNLTAGGSGSADRFSAYRLGGDLPMISEFPLIIPGYFQSELSARNFACFNGKYTLPLDGAKDGA